MGQTSRWQVGLEGHQFDLEDLALLFTAPELRVIIDEGAYWLESTRFGDLQNSKSVFHEAQRVVRLLNGAVRLRRRNFRDVRLGNGVREIGPDGVKRHAYVQTDPIEIRSKVHTPSISGDAVQDEPGESEQNRWVAAAFADSDAADALRIWGSQEHNWFNLYKVFEIIESRADIQGEGWASRNEIGRFTRTANHEKAAGEGSRHARSKAQPPRRPVTLSEGDAFIERVLRAWIESV